MSVKLRQELRTTALRLLALAQELEEVESRRRSKGQIEREDRARELAAPKRKYKKRAKVKKLALTAAAKKAKSDKA